MKHQHKKLFLKEIPVQWMNLKNGIQSLKTDFSLSIKNVAIFWQYR